MSETNNNMEGVTDKIKWFKYVVYDRIEDYENTGWIVVAVLGEHSVLMEWVQDGEPRLPEMDND